MAVTLVDVGPRDGLQNETVVLAPGVRADLCNRLGAAGIPRIEAGSFVNPRLVPHMAGTEDVFAALKRRPGVIYAGLVLNERDYERARVSGVDEVRFAFPVTDTFCRRNQNATVDAALALAQRLARRAHEDGLRVVITLSAASGCPLEGRVAPARVLDLAAQVPRAAPDEIVLADTVGVGVPRQVRELVAGCHFHNTRNTGFTNALAAVEAGATVLDASVGGLGNCPFAPRATGNIATEDLVYLFRGMGYELSIDLQALIACAAWLSDQLGKVLPGQVYKAGAFAPVAQ
jgi:(R)-citramalyl-CoA lyase